MINRVAKIVEERKIEIFEEEMPVLGDNQILVKIQAIGICGSDLHYFRHCGLGSFKNPLPIHIGHEPAGTVVLSSSDKFKIGDRVAIEPGINCGKCEYCNRGLHNLCSNTKFLGANDIGAFRDYIILEPERLFKIYDMPFEKAALLEPLGVALHAVDRVHCALDDEVAIFGSGTIGLCILSVLKKMGCKVTMFDPLTYRLHVAKFLRADEVHVNNENTKVDEFKNRFKVVFDAVGTQDSISKCIKVVAPTGEVCIVGIPEIDDLVLNPHQMRVKELTITNSRRSNQKLDKAYRLYQKDQDIDAMITHRFPLDQIQHAFELAADYKDSAVKIMIVNE